MVDIVALDSAGALVFIEVKNERSPRSAIGQALEYLSQYQDATVEELEEAFLEESQEALSTAYQKRFGHPLTTLSAKRRVYIAAPEFDYHSEICRQFLTKALAAHSVEFGLLKIRCSSDESNQFSLERNPRIELTSARKLTGFVMSPRGRLYYVLDEGALPVMWRIGKCDENGRVENLRTTGLRRLVRVRAKPHVQLSGPPPGVEVPAGDLTWKKKKDPSQQAKTLGIIRVGSARGAVLARFVEGRFQRFQAKGYEQLLADWDAVPVPGLPNWRQLAKLTN